MPEARAIQACRATMDSHSIYPESLLSEIVTAAKRGTPDDMAFLTQIVYFAAGHISSFER